jgi:hypothetical protein
MWMLVCVGAHVLKRFACCNLETILVGPSLPLCLLSCFFFVYIYSWTWLTDGVSFLFFFFPLLCLFLSSVVQCDGQSRSTPPPSPPLEALVAVDEVCVDVRVVCNRQRTASSMFLW